MGKSPRYTTYQEGELEATLRELNSFADARDRSDPAGRRFQNNSNMATETGRSATGLITAHSCPVTYPDGGIGVCRYTRAGPTWHVFRFEHTGKRSGKTAPLPVQNETARITNTVAAIEETAQRLAGQAFSAAARQERRDYFGRATPPYHRKAEGGEHPQMKTKEAKETSGKYALCIRVGKSLLPTGVPSVQPPSELRSAREALRTSTWNTLEEAVTAWQESANVSLVIGCCCRWKRRWEEPEYNPLHGDSCYPLPFPCPGDESGQERAKGALDEVLKGTSDTHESSEDEPEDDWLADEETEGRDEEL